jgi:hypothetical protein
MLIPKTTAQKNGDGSYTVRVFQSQDRSTDVVFPHDAENERLALEYADFKNSQKVSGPDSPATQSVMSDYRAMQSNDEHERLMEKAAKNLVPQKPAEETPSTPDTVVASVGNNKGENIETPTPDPTSLTTDAETPDPTAGTPPAQTETPAPTPTAPTPSAKSALVKGEVKKPTTKPVETPAKTKE